MDSAESDSITTKVYGACKLCQTKNVELQRSHFIPKGIYKILRDDGFQNPNPVQVTNHATVQTSKQMRAHLLCKDCEGRFSKRGENWVLANCLRQDGSFSMREALNSRKADVLANSNSTKIYFASQIPEIDVDALIYFAISMFWRGAIYPWNDNGTYPVVLGPYEEVLRRFLMDEEPLPDSVVLWVLHRQESEISRMAYAPFTRSTRDPFDPARQFRAHIFPIPGLAFSLAVENQPPAIFRQHCFIARTEHPIISSREIESALVSEVHIKESFQEGQRRLQESAKKKSDRP